jgi:hypothetical protein
MNNKDMIPVNVGTECMKFICEVQRALIHKLVEITKEWNEKHIESLFSDHLSQIKEEHRAGVKDGIRHGMVYTLNSLLFSYSETFLKLVENIQDDVEFDENEKRAIKAAEMVDGSSEMEE